MTNKKNKNRLISADEVIKKIISVCEKEGKKANLTREQIVRLMFTIAQSFAG
ncbi:MAG: hypothetical protein KGJ01_02955 [Patescibacteria group bacterium]|nr:hypothetical protein [Patescibacteria group bacterium]